MFTSWKTTVAGWCAIAIAVASAIQSQIDNDPTTIPDWASAVGLLVGGIGLLFARDNDTSSEKAGAK